MICAIVDTLIYPKKNFTDATVKIWEIAYPSHIHPNVKYLKTGFPEIDQNLQLQ